MNGIVKKKDDFYSNLNNVIPHVQHREELILIWGFNIRIGFNHQVWECVPEYHGVGRMNINSRLLLSISSKFNLLINNAYFHQANCGRLSWMPPRSKDWHFIDYVINKKRYLMDISITHSFHNTCWHSDHAILRTKGPFRLAHRRLQTTCIPNRINSLVLKLPEIQSWILIWMPSSLLSIFNPLGKQIGLQCILLLWGARTTGSEKPKLVWGKQHGVLLLIDKCASHTKHGFMTKTLLHEDSVHEVQMRVSAISQENGEILQNFQ